jgi:hypothetical protein
VHYFDPGWTSLNRGPIATFTPGRELTRYFLDNRLCLDIMSGVEYDVNNVRDARVPSCEVRQPPAKPGTPKFAKVMVQ